MQETILEKVLEILNTYIENAEVTQNLLDEDLAVNGMDSIAFIRIIVALEEEFECEIPDEKLFIPEMNTVNKILNVLAELKSEQTV